MADASVSCEIVDRASGRARAAGKTSLVTAAMPALAAIMLLGTLLVLPRLGSQSFWLDETLTFGPALEATSVGDLVHRIRVVDTQPPGSHLVLYALRDVLPRNELGLRLPSFLAFELAVLMLYLAVARLWGSSVALGTAALAQLSPFLCFYAAEARNYALWFLVVVASLAAATRWLESARAGAAAATWKWAIAWGVVNACGLWTHLFHAFAVFAQIVVIAVAFAAQRREWRARGRAAASLIVAQVVTGVLFAPWALVMAREIGTGRIGVPWTRPFSAASLGYYVFAAHFGGSLGPSLRTLHVAQSAELLARDPIVLALAAVAMAVTAWTYARLVRDARRDPSRRWELLPLVVWPLASVAGPIAYAAATHFPLHPRHLVFAWPLLPLILALGFQRYRRLRPALAAAAVLQVVALGNLLFDPYYAKDDERGAVAFAEQHSGRNAYVLGDVAPYYATRVHGDLKNFRAFGAAPDDVWLVDNRSWEKQNRRWRRDLDRTMTRLGLSYQGGTTSFRGIVLRHWTRKSS